jgi:hypothetical protein
MLPPAAGAWSRTTQLLQGVTYTKEVRWAYGGPLVTHVIISPRPGGLYDLKPVLSNGTVSGRETTSSMERRFSGSATLAGVNGDYSSWATGHPSGIFVRKNVLFSRPEGGRSSLAIGLDGLLRINRIGFAATWQVEGFAAHRLREFNRPLTRWGVALFKPSWGARTPATPGVLEAVLTGVPRLRPNVEAGGIVLRRRSGGGHPIPPGGAVLQARGSWIDVLRAQAKPDRRVSLTLGLDPWQTDAPDAIGGGPLLVQDGAAVTDAFEDFTQDQILPRHPRTAVGQLADGRIILVVADGRSAVSAGLRTWQLALEMVRLGAVRAMGLDGGGSSTMAVNGRVLNTPSDGSERPVGNGLFVFYYGVYAPLPRYRSFSPNGDGVADTQRLAAKLVRRSDVLLRLIRPDGAVRWRYRGSQPPGTIVKTFSRRGASEGRWRWSVSATDARGRTSHMERRFVVNRTLGFLQLSKTRMRVRPFSGGRLVASVRLTNPSRFSIAVRRHGRLVRMLYSSPDQPPGAYAVVWNGKTSDNRVVRTGTYTVRVKARNELGTAVLERSVWVKKVTLSAPSAG